MPQHLTHLRQRRPGPQHRGGQAVTSWCAPIRASPARWQALPTTCPIAPADSGWGQQDAAPVDDNQDAYGAQDDGGGWGSDEEV